MKQPPAIGQPNHDQNFIRAWAIAQAHRNRVKMSARPDIILMPER
jgi:hypothetical protein